MALIKCKECGKQVSDKAKSCPHCGCPAEYMKDKEENIVNEPYGDVVIYRGQRTDYWVEMW